MSVKDDTLLLTYRTNYTLRMRLKFMHRSEERDDRGMYSMRKSLWIDFKRAFSSLTFSREMIRNVAIIAHVDHGIQRELY